MYILAMNYSLSRGVGWPPPCARVSSRAVRLTFVIAFFCIVPSAHCIGGDDFSNNLFSDLSPLLALFGEQVTKQYLSDSMGWADHVLFAMVPLGILTAVVSAIRCGGPRWLKAIVGRAKESRATVELELMSSTSADVCELWNGHNLVRAIGNPSIMQLFYSKEQSPARSCGIYLFEELKRGGYIKRSWRNIHDDNIPMVPFGEAEEDPLMGSTDAIDFEADVERRLLLNSTELAPNISLNTHGNGISPWEMWLWAVFGIMIQLGLLIFAGVSSLYQRWGDTFFRDGKRVPLWAIILNTLGTTFLAIGMMLCCYLTDKSSKEERWEFNPSAVRPSVVWLQKGGAVGDQHFNSYAIFARTPEPNGIFKKFFRRVLFHYRNRPRYPTSHRDRIKQFFLRVLCDPNSRFVTSHRDLSIDNPPPGFSLAVVIATGMSISGFIIQFVALRNLHWSFPVTQLGCTLLMTAVRAWARRNLFSEPVAKEIDKGYELDFLAREIAGCKPLSADWVYVKDSVGGIAGTGTTIPSAEDTKHQSIVDRVFRIRKRLGALSPWESHLRETTWSLCRAIEGVMRALQDSPHIILKDIRDLNVFTWKIRIRSGLPEEPEDLNSPVAELELHLKRSKPIDNSLAPWGDWMVENDALEALLSLLLENKAMRSKARVESESTTPYRRLFFNSQNAWERQIFKWWIDHRNIQISGWSEIGNVAPDEGMSVACTDLNTSCAQEVFTSFFSEVTEQIIERIEGPVELRLAGRSGLHAFGLKCDVIASLVDIVKNCGLCTEGEAFLAIVDPLALHGKLPDLKLAISDIYERLQDPTFLKPGDLEEFFWHLLKAQSALCLGSGEPDWGSAISFLKGQLEALITSQLGVPRKTALLTHLAWMSKTLLHQAYLGGSPDFLQMQDIIYDTDSYEVKGPLPVGQLATINKFLSGVFTQNNLDPSIESHQKSVFYDYSSQSPAEQWAITLENLEAAVEAGYFEVIDFILSRSCTRTFTEVDLKALENSFEKAVQKADPDIINTFITHLHILAATNCISLNAIKAEPLLCSLAFGGFDSAKQLLSSSDILLRYNTLPRAAADGDIELVQLLLDKGAEVNSPAVNIDEQNALVEAADSGNFNMVQQLLEGNINGLTALKTAAMGGHLDIVRLLLTKGAKINTSADDFPLFIGFQEASGGSYFEVADLIHTANINHLTAVQAAAGGGHLEVVKVLLDQGAHINPPMTQFGRTPLQAAAGGGHLDVVEFLVDKGANISAEAVSFRGRTAVQAAAESGNLALVKFLISKGGIIDEPPAITSGRTALQAAAEGGHFDVVEHLLTTPRQREEIIAAAKGLTAFQAAAGKGHINVLRLLAHYNIPCNEPAGSSYGRTAMQAAAGGGHLDVIRFLLDSCSAPVTGQSPKVVTPQQPSVGGTTAGNEPDNLQRRKASINEPAGTYGRTALQAAAENGHLDVVQLFLDMEVINSSAGKDGYTALQVAAGAGHLEIIKLLVSKGYRINEPPGPDSGRTALQNAAQNGHINIVRLLIDEGAEVNEPPALHDGATALQAAAGNGHIEIVKLLVQEGANINAPAFWGGRTALAAAAFRGRLEVVKFLLANGADVNAPGPQEFDDHNRTALKDAASKGHSQVVEVLRQAGATDEIAPLSRRERQRMQYQMYLASR